jgi:Lrp/AsnC family transcriptional regulator, regulator for asnA, asnC and gidA
MANQAYIDQIDSKIIESLLKDGRASFSDIAKTCGISTNAIVKRYERLRKEEIIVGTTLLVRLDDFGYKFIVSIDMNVETGQEIPIQKVIRDLPNFFVYNETVGKYDIHAVILAKNYDEINEARDFLKKQKGIKRIKVTANMDKRFYFPENVSIKSTEPTTNG